MALRTTALPHVDRPRLRRARAALCARRGASGPPRGGGVRARSPGARALGGRACARRARRRHGRRPRRGGAQGGGRAPGPATRPDRPLDGRPHRDTLCAAPRRPAGGARALGTRRRRQPRDRDAADDGPDPRVPDRSVDAVARSRGRTRVRGRPARLAWAVQASNPGRDGGGGTGERRGTVVRSAAGPLAARRGRRAGPGRARRDPRSSVSPASAWKRSSIRARATRS